MPTLVTRFAPSPTGLLHLGHAYSALAGWRRARATAGKFRLRIEDIDAVRCRPEYRDAILEDLAWLGLDWDGKVRVQSAHLAEYRATLGMLDQQGLLYPCFCARADIAAAATAPHGPEGPLYPGTCRNLPAAERAARVAAGEVHAMRLDMGAALAQVGDLTFHEEGEGRIACHPERFGDVVLGRKDAPASYHLCVTHDDAAGAVTLVTRGEDLKPATDLHRLLQVLLGWAEPGYAHHRLITGPDGKRLSKRDGAATLRALREAGRTPAEVRALAGWAD